MSKPLHNLPYIAITAYEGASSGFSVVISKRYRAELVGYDQKTVQLGHYGHAYGFSSQASAKAAAKPYVDALRLPLVYIDTYGKVDSVQEYSASPSRTYWEGYKLELDDPYSVFVFGSNPEGRHGAGAAKYAVLNYGAAYGQSRGLQGNSYALPTKNLTAGYTEPATGIKYLTAGVRSLTPQQIEANIAELYEHAASNPHYTYYIAYTMDGRNLNGYSGEEMRDMFMHTEPPENIVFHESFM